MQIVKKIFGINLLTSVLFLIFGLFLVFKTEGTIQLIASLIGVILLLNGGFSFIKYFKNQEDSSTVDLVYGIFAIVAALALILNPEAVASILPFVLGMYFTITGLIKLKYAMDIKKYGTENPIFMIILSFLTVFCGILFIVRPFAGAIAITQIIGIFMIAYSCLDILNYFLLRRDLKDLEKIFDERR